MSVANIPSTAIKPGQIIATSDTGATGTYPASKLASVVNNAAAGTMIKLSQGTFALGSTGLVVPDGVSIYGSGRPFVYRQNNSTNGTQSGQTNSSSLINGGTQIVYTATTGTAISLSNPTTLEDFAVVGPFNATSGAGISFALSSYMGVGAMLRGLLVSGFFNGITHNGLTYSSFTNLVVLDSANYGIFQTNSLSVDNGDNAYVGCTICGWNGPQNAVSAFRWESGGGVKISACKINGGFATGLDFYGTGNTADIIITGNSIEGAVTAAISLAQPSGSTENVVISGNQIAAFSTYGIHVTGMSNIAIDDNAFGAQTVGISVTGTAAGVNIGGGNIYTGVEIPIQIAGGLANIRIAPQYRTDLGQINQDPSANGVGGVFEHDYTSEFPGAGNGNGPFTIFKFTSTAYESGTIRVSLAGGVNGIGTLAYDGGLWTWELDGGSTVVVTQVVAPTATIGMGSGTDQVSVSFVTTSETEVDVVVTINSPSSASGIYGSARVQTTGKISAYRTM